MALYDLQQQDVRPFKLSEEFLEPYKTRKPDFGFNGLGEVTYRRTYSRVMPDGKKEEWWQTIRRVIEGVYTMQKKWIISNNLGWDNLKAQKSAKEMYERMFSMKFLPAGRGLWAWGTPITEEKGLYLALNSCAMVTTENIREKLAEPFCFLMDASMLGVGVGFDTKGAGKLTINKPIDDVEIYQITDDREGWVISVEKLINSYFLPNQKIMEFDYSLIRPAGEPIKGFGGISSGSEALKQLHINLRTILDNRVGDKISSQDIVDMMNLIGTCVISGNVRRCLRKGTLVFTSEGAKPIENIVVGDTVFTSKGTTTVTEAVYQGKQELLRINTDAGFIDCTDKHRIAVLDTPQSYVWKHANEITLDDRLVFINTHDRSFGYKKLIPAKVLSIEPIGIDDTYDLSVLDKQEFVLGNGLLVHNTAEIAFGEVDDKEFLNLKNYDLHPERMDYGWTSNNSIFAQLGMSYDDIAERIKDNGEPGLEWLDNARAYSRMIDAPDYKDKKVVGANPCVTGDTLVAVADGRDYVPIKQLADEGKDVQVYCLSNDGKIAIRTMRNPRLTGINEPIYEVILDSGDKIHVTPNHKFILADGSSKEAIDLVAGDSLSIMTKFWDTLSSVRSFPEGKFRPEYAHLIDANGNIISEHILVGETKYGYKTPKGYHIHHVDFNCKNNSPDNLVMLPARSHRQLHMNGEKNPMVRAKAEWSDDKWTEYRQIQSDLNAGDKNSHAYEVTNEEIKEHALSLTKSLKRRFSTDEWEAYAVQNNLPKSFSTWRQTTFGSVLSMAKWAAEQLNYNEYSELDPRTVRYYMDMLEAGYNCDIIDDAVVFTKTCEVCGKVFQTKKREASLCGSTCGNKSSWNNEEARKNRIQGMQRTNEGKKEIIRQKQAQIYNDLKFALGHEPMRKEWESACKENNVSPEIARKSSPFTSYEQLKKLANTYNHKVVSVTYVGKEDVYNGTVDEFHNFAIGSFNNESVKNGKTSVFTLQCGEQSLESYESCLLVETFPNRNIDLEDYKRTLKFAYLYAKTVTLAKTHWAETNRVMLRNRRIGLSMSGIAQFITDRGLHELKQWCEEGYKTIRYYDGIYSDWLAIPKSIKVTSVKPSGSVSLLAGATAGIHYPESNFYIRRIRLSKFSDLIEPLKRAGYKIEPAIGQEDSTVVAEFPISLGEKMRTIKDVSMWEQLSLGAFMQKYWSDNQVSQTVTFNPKTEGKDIAHALEYFQYQLKGVSFLPALEYESYPQMPYEAITEEEYNSMMEKITEIDFSGNVEDAIDEKFCNNDVCTIL